MIAPQGMLEPWALRNSAWKKRLFTFFVEGWNLRNAACFHVVCEPERHHIKRKFPDKPVALLANGVDLQRLDDSRTSREAARDELGIESSRKFLLSLGRIHPKKGLANLLRALADSRPGNLDKQWVLVVAGPDQLGHRTELENQARELGISDFVRFVGPLYGRDKAAAFAAADAFVLTSHSEGLPVAVLEAMAYELPVLITTECHLDAVQTAGAGLVSPPNAEAVRIAVREFLALDSSRLSEMGTAGRQLVENEFTWDRIATDSIRLYEWLMGRGDQPEFVS